MINDQNDKKDNLAVNQQNDNKSSFSGNNLKKLGRKGFDFNDLKWMLSALGIIASFFNSIGLSTQCEEVYVKYITLIEEFYGRDSMETANAYFMIGVYYFEQEQFQKSLACFIKTLYLRRNSLGESSLGAADCHYNMGILYKKLNIGKRALMHY